MFNFATEKRRNRRVTTLDFYAYLTLEFSFFLWLRFKVNPQEKQTVNITYYIQTIVTTKERISCTQKILLLSHARAITRPQMKVTRARMAEQMSWKYAPYVSRECIFLLHRQSERENWRALFEFLFIIERILQIRILIMIQ